MSVEIHHGGALDEAAALFGEPADGWLDLSTGVNPEAYPNTDVSPESWRQLPQRARMEALLHAARRYYRVPAGADIVAAPGSQALLQLLPAVAPTGAVAILGPTYAEHARIWSEANRRVHAVEAVAELQSAEIAVIVNPNNPDGRLVAPARLIGLIEDKQSKTTLLIIDEAFADIDPATSVVPYLDGEPILVIRSFGKFFGLPGLRLGFAIGKPDMIGNLRRNLGPWAVSGPALEIGARALADTAWIEGARLADRRAALDSVLRAAGLNVTGGTDLFRLIEDDRVPRLFRHLGVAGIFTRIFPEYPTRMRLGVPGSPEALQRLHAALRTAPT